MSYPKSGRLGTTTTTTTMRLLFLLLLSSSFFINMSQAVSSMPQKIHEKYIMESFNELCNEENDNIKTRFADDVEIKFCFTGMPNDGGCLKGNFDDTFGLILNRGCAKFTGDPRGFRSSISDTNGIVSFVLYFATKDACVSNTATTSYHELNSNGKTSKLYVYSEDGTEFVKCLGGILNSSSEKEEEGTKEEEEDESEEEKQTTEKEEVKKEETTTSTTNNEL